MRTFHVKQKESKAWVFPESAHTSLLEGSGVVGLTRDSTPVFLSEHLLYRNSSFFVELENEDDAFSFYGSCLEFEQGSFGFYPPQKTKDAVPGFDLGNNRFRKEVVVKFFSSTVFCCIGTNQSLRERSIPIDTEDRMVQSVFKVGDVIDVAVVSEMLFSMGYEKTDITLSPGTYSLRGDVLDVFPRHFRNPFRFSFDFDTIESIALYDPNTQLTIKPLNKLHLVDHEVGEQTIDNIDIIKHSGSLVVIRVVVSGENVSLVSGLKNKHFDLGLKKIILSGKTPVERAKSVSVLSEKIKKHILIGQKTRFSLELFDSDKITIVKPGSINRCAISTTLSTVIISENDIYSKRPLGDRWSPLVGQDGLALDKNSIAGTAVGDFVVHRDFGIGLYRGIKIKNGRESIEVEYGNNTLVYVSLDQVNLIHRYVGSGKRPKVSSLGSKKWASEIKKAKTAAENIAVDVFRGYSNKAQLRSFKYTKENDLDEVLSLSFSFIETPDQKTAISDVFSDMNMSTPMDRLVCGDVGFGKTEVAIRAMFKAFLSDKVSVFLCPTTILADQHYMTCQERLGSLGVSVSLLSRFKSKAEQVRIIEDLKLKKIDVLIGTHRVLSKDVVLPGLGLLVIDEEHRFGVGHKETIKKIRDGVDVLTLTATPIPRTLQQTLVGLKDISVMLSPPKTRRPVLTTVKFFDWSLVFSRVEFELTRSGQVYYLNNDITSIPSTVEKLRNRFPDNVVAGASGKMKSKELEEIVLAFFRGDIDILVCTTIIESGLDVTNANSIIIKDAQNLGLAQLYQIRGRVGRGDRQAYCHLLIPNGKLEESAFKRLRSLEQNTALGSGYNISMQDLEIRGAGAVFGHKQSGHVSMVGFQIYCDLLSSEIKKKTNPNTVGCVAPQITTPLSTNIDESYVGSMSSRVDFYYRVGVASTSGGLEKIKRELIDVFGPIPQTTKNLISLAALRIAYTETPVVFIDCQNKEVNMVLESLEEKKLFMLLSVVGDFKNPKVSQLRFKERGDGRMGVVFVLFKSADFFEVLFSFVELFDIINKD